MFIAMFEIDKKTRRLLRDPGRRWAWIKYQLDMRRTSLAQVAAKAGVTRQCISHVSKTPYPRMEKAIADALGLSPQDLFPERYDADGLPNRRMGRPKKSLVSETENNTRSQARNVGKQEAA